MFRNSFTNAENFDYAIARCGIRDGLIILLLNLKLEIVEELTKTRFLKEGNKRLGEI